MCKSEEKILEKTFIEAVRELIELTGESPSSVYEWIQHHAKLQPFTGTRETFYRRVQRGWARKSSPTQTRDCRLCSRPLACELRVRAISLWFQFKQDIKTGRYRQVVILAGYEKCTRMLHFRIYRCSETSVEEKASYMSSEIEPAELISFVGEFGTMLGLPLRRIRLSQCLISDASEGFRCISYLDHKKPKFVTLKTEGQIGSSFIPIVKDQAKIIHYVADDLICAFCQQMSATRFAELLGGVVNLHNRRVALPFLKNGQESLRKLSAVSEARASQSKWGSPAVRRQKHPLLVYLDGMPWLSNEEERCKEVGRTKYIYRTFTTCPGDA